MDLRKNVIVVLIGVMMCAFSTPLPSLDSAHARPSGCHEHGSKSPARSYDCCLIGHDVAAPQGFHFFRRAVESMNFDFQIWSSPSSGAVALGTAKPPAVHPPGRTSLRI